MKKIFVPPIKSQGIKTKLVDWINNTLQDVEYDRWVEPFMGTGSVAFNIRPKKALLCDSNPHIINFYKSLQNNEINSNIVRSFLIEEGDKLYYMVNTIKSNHEIGFILKTATARVGATEE